MTTKDLMPTGMLTGTGGSYADAMHYDKFLAMCGKPIANAILDANQMGIELLPDTEGQAFQKVQRIVRASGFHFSETSRHVDVAIRIAATATAMLGYTPDPHMIHEVIAS